MSFALSPVAASIAATILMSLPLDAQIVVPTPLDDFDLDSLRGPIARIVETTYTIGRSEVEPEERLSSTMFAAFDERLRPLVVDVTPASNEPVIGVLLTWTDSVVRTRTMTGDPDLAIETLYRYGADRLTSMLSIHVDKALVVDTVFDQRLEYDAAGRLVQSTRLAGDSLARVVERQTYDRRGNIQELTRTSSKSTETTYFTVDSLGRVIEAITHASGIGPSRLVYEYDSLGRTTEVRAYETSEEGWHRWFTQQFRYDARGNLILHYDDRSIGFSSRYEYTYDTLGNWTTRRTFRGELVDGHALYMPAEISRRTIEYAKE